VFVSLVAAESADGNEQESDNEEYQKEFSPLRIVEIDSWISRGSIGRNSLLSPAFAQESDQDCDDAANENRRNYHPGEDADVRTASPACDIDQKQQQDTGETRQRYRCANQTDVVAKQLHIESLWTTKKHTKHKQA
jgi:hypothetical protein